MPKACVPEEVAVLRFFEEGPLENVKPVFNIVTEKMRARLAAGAHAGDPSPKKKRHAAKEAGEARTGGEAEHSSPNARNSL